MAKAPDDKKNLFRKNFPRFAFQSGQSSIHGDANFQVQTQEAQSFSFHASTGEGASEGGGPGTGKAVLYTPGSSTEVLGEGLKVRDAGDIVQLPAKIIKCKRGDTIIECENGDIVLRARNITIDATGGGQDGVLNLIGSRIIDVDAPDIRLQGEKITERATKDFIMISEGFTEMKSAFTIAATKADEQFGAMAKILEETTSIIKPQVGEATEAIKKKVEESGIKDQLRDVAEGFAEQFGGL
tara:strand:+ start:97 stop:819 length:723 start_codon:yes stop_codon:yes gene_type:complete